MVKENALLHKKAGNLYPLFVKYTTKDENNKDHIVKKQKIMYNFRGNSFTTDIVFTSFSIYLVSNPLSIYI
tara:strand:- start:847 stop:1059 length:213 start_codon:yes stop_codon:yes gene_type:complete